MSRRSYVALIAGLTMTVAAPAAAGERAADQGIADVQSSHGVVQVWLSYNSPAWLQRRHGLSEDLVKNVAGISGLVQPAAGP